MAQTPLTSSDGYATTSEVLNFVDGRTVGDLVSDDDTRVTSLTNNAVFLAIIKRASGMIESAAVLGERYTPDDLAALTGSAKQMLIGLVADISIGLLYRRRPNKGKPPASYDEALAVLQQIRDGHRIFPTVEAAEAGHADHEIEDEYDVIARNGLSTVAARYFGTRVRNYRQNPS